MTRSRPSCCFVRRRVYSPAKNMIIFTDILLNDALRAPLKRCTAGAPCGRQGTRVFRRTSRCPLLYMPWRGWSVLQSPRAPKQGCALRQNKPPQDSRGRDRRRAERGARFDSRHRKVFGSNFPEYTSPMRRIAPYTDNKLHPGPKHYKSTVLFDCHLYFAWKDSGRARWVAPRLQPQHGRNGGQLHIEFFRLHRPIKLRLCALRSGPRMAPYTAREKVPQHDPRRVCPWGTLRTFSRARLRSRMQTQCLSRRCVRTMEVQAT